MRRSPGTYNGQLRACEQSRADAKRGRVGAALQSLADMVHEGPANTKIEAEILRHEGLIRRDCLGQGLQSRELFSRAATIDPTNAFAVENALLLARNEAEFREELPHFFDLVPAKDPSRDGVNELIGELQQGVPYWEVLASLASGMEASGYPGSAAALAELVLALGEMPPDKEAGYRRWRAQQLRNAGKLGERTLERTLWRYPPAERLHLFQALEEIERALALDPYDAECWNLKAAWSYMGGRPADAIEAADRAIELRPHGYAKPHINKALTFQGLGRLSDAMACADEACRQAVEAQDPNEHAQALEVRTNLLTGKGPKGPRRAAKVLAAILSGVGALFAGLGIAGLLLWQWSWVIVIPLLLVGVFLGSMALFLTYISFAVFPCPKCGGTAVKCGKDNWYCSNCDRVTPS